MTIEKAADNLPTNVGLWHGTNGTNPHDTISQVREFENACGATLYPLGTPPPLDKLKLRLSLELEELYEKAQAMGLEGTFQHMMENRIPQHAVVRGSVGETEYDYSVDTGVYDPVALLDACVDQRYVQDGTMLTCGLDVAFLEAFANIQVSNMSKFCHDKQSLKDTLKDYRDKGVEVQIANLDAKDYPLAVRRADGKILKNKYYEPANLAPIVAKYTQS